MKLFKNANTCIFFLCLFLISLSGCSKKETNAYTIKGSITNLESPHIYIVTETSDSILMDTIYADRKGDFLYKGKTDHLIMSYLYLGKESYPILVFIDKNYKIEINGSAETPYLIEVNGGETNDSLTAFRKINASLLAEKADLFVQMQDTAINKQNEDYIEKINNVNCVLTNNARLFIENNPEKIASVLLVQDFYKNSESADSLDKKLSLLKNEAARFYLTKRLKKYSEKVQLSQLNAIAPAFIVTNKEKEIKLEDFKDKYLLLTFSSSKKNIGDYELSSIIKLYNKNKKEIDILSIVMDNKTVKETPDSIKWKVYYDEKVWASNIVKDYNIVEIPYYILISPEGKILKREQSVTSVIEMIEEKLQNSKKEK